MSVFSVNFEIEVGTPYALEVPKAGTYFVESVSPNVVLSVSPHIGGSDAVGRGLNSVEFSVESATTMYIIATPTISGIQTVHCVANNYSATGSSGGGCSCGVEYVFESPLQNLDNTISILPDSFTPYSVPTPQNPTDAVSKEYLEQVLRVVNLEPGQAPTASQIPVNSFIFVS